MDSQTRRLLAIIAWENLRTRPPLHKKRWMESKEKEQEQTDKEKYKQRNNGCEEERRGQRKEGKNKMRKE